MQNKHETYPPSKRSQIRRGKTLEDIGRNWGPEAAKWGQLAPPWQGRRPRVRVLAPLLEASSTASEESS